MNKTLISSLIACLLGVSIALAAPGLRVRRSVQLVDGSTIYVTLFGDEHASWLVADDGFVVEPTTDGTAYVKTNLTFEEATKAYADDAAASSKRAPRRIGSQATAPLSSKGTALIPVLLVNFSDSVFHVADTDEGVVEYYDRFCNGTWDGNLYKGAGSYGSIRDYFVQQSDSLFLPEFTIIGPVTLNRPQKDYASNGTKFSTDAVQLATKTFAIDWSAFDSRGKNQVDMVFIIFAGCGANTTGDRKNHIWPNERAIGSIPVDEVNTHYVNFVCSGCCSENTFSEPQQGVTTAKPDGIGVFCHELSHALGLPDFYDTNYKAFGMDLWSLMDYGCYGGNGYCPGAYTAYERDFMGWRSLQELNKPCDLTLLPMEQGGIGYKIVNEENPNEYYVIENRQRIRWDTAVGKYSNNGKMGLQVTHVDYNAGSWNNNSVNTAANHQRMTIIAANNMYYGTSYLQNNPSATTAMLLDTWAGNLYPFEQNDSLTTFSTPAASVFSYGGFMHKNLNAICRQEDGSVTLRFSNDYWQWPLGDVNDDGIVDITDAIMIVYYALGEEPKGFIKEAADMNDDGNIDITDAVIVVYQVLNKES